MTPPSSVSTCGQPMPTVARYPSGREYREALFNTKLCFQDPALVDGVVVMDALGMPKPISGASGCVFTVRNAKGRRWAVKCFTHSVDHQAVRYQRISETLQTINKPWRVEFEYLHDGVLCAGIWYPVLKMEWIEATGLIPFIEKHLWEPVVIADLAGKFVRMVRELSALNIAHGDLQHGNLLVTPSGELKLIDYDGMFVPGLANIGACEKGHLNYQSPTRTMRTWGPYLDNFSAWVIYTSLVALTIDPTLWSLLHNPGDEAVVSAHRLSRSTQLPRPPCPLPEFRACSSRSRDGNVQRVGSGGWRDSSTEPRRPPSARPTARLFPAEIITSSTNHHQCST